MVLIGQIFIAFNLILAECLFMFGLYKKKKVKKLNNLKK